MDARVYLNEKFVKLISVAGFREPTKVLVASHVRAPQSKLRAVYRKYAGEQFARVSMQPPAVAAQGLA
jgi:hypothetical protein